MAFIIDKEELKTGLIIFRRGDVAHRNFYCRIKLPSEDRYKTYSLKTSEVGRAREDAFEKAAELRTMIKHDVPVFNRPFRQVAEEYLTTQQRRADTGEVSQDRIKNLRNAFKKALDDYVGSTQIHLIVTQGQTAAPCGRDLQQRGGWIDDLRVCAGIDGQAGDRQRRAAQSVGSGGMRGDHRGARQRPQSPASACQADRQPHA